MRILVIEDNKDLAANLVDFLEARGHVVDRGGDGLTGLHLAVTEAFDAIVLDLALPGIDGLEVCRRLRSEGYTTPIIALTARGEVEERIEGLETGADDYLVKPVSLKELETRIRAQVRRAQGGLETARYRIGDLVLDERTHVVTRAGQTIALSRVDFLILRALVRRSPEVITRQRLETEIWGDDPPESDSLRVHIHRLRRAVDLPGSPAMIQNVRGVGYRLVSDDSVAS